MSSLDCRGFADSSASCLDGSCVCSDAADVSDYCSTNSTVATPVSYVLTFEIPCETFFADISLQITLRSACETAAAVYDVTVTVIFSCGSTNVIVSADVPISQVVSLSNDLTTQVDAATKDTVLEGTRTTTATQLEEGTATTCTPTLPVLTAVSIGGSCVAASCATGYSLVSEEGQAFVASCVETTTTDSDDDLSDGEIAGIVLGSIAGAGILLAIIMLVACKGKKADEENQKEAPEDDGEVIEVSDVLV